MKYFFLLIFLVPLFATAQEKPDIFPEDINGQLIELPCYCSPGVIGKSRSRGMELSYKYNGNALVKGEGETLQEPYSNIKSQQALTLKLKVPIINRPGFKVLLGYGYRSEVVNFENIGIDYTEQFRHLDGQRLKNNSFGLTTVNSFANSYFSAKLKISSNGDYNTLMKFQDRYLVYNLIAAYGVKKREDLEWGFGISLSHSFRNNNIIPFFIYNRSFNEKWGIEMVLPALIMGRCNIDHNTILLAGIEYNSKSYSITSPIEPNELGFIYNCNHSEVNSFMRLERHIVPWLWMSAEAGYQWNFSSDFESTAEDDAPSFMVDPENTLFFKVGLFISPPDNFFK